MPPSLFLYRIICTMNAVRSSCGSWPAWTTPHLQGFAVPPSVFLYRTIFTRERSALLVRDMPCACCSKLCFDILLSVPLGLCMCRPRCLNPLHRAARVVCESCRHGGRVVVRVLGAADQLGGVLQARGQGIGQGCGCCGSGGRVLQARGDRREGVPGDSHGPWVWVLMDKV